MLILVYTFVTDCHLCKAYPHLPRPLSIKITLAPIINPTPPSLRVTLTPSHPHPTTRVTLSQVTRTPPIWYHSPPVTTLHPTTRLTLSQAGGRGS